MSQFNALASLFLNICESEGTSATEVFKQAIHLFRDYGPNRGIAVNDVIADDAFPGNSRKDLIPSVSVKGQGRPVSQKDIFCGMRSTIKK